MAPEEMPVLDSDDLSEIFGSPQESGRGESEIPFRRPEDSKPIQKADRLLFRKPTVAMTVLLVLLNLHDVEMQCLSVLSVVFAYTFGGFHFLRCFSVQDLKSNAWRQNATFLCLNTKKSENVIPDDLDV